MRLIALCLCLLLALPFGGAGRAQSVAQELSRAEALLLGRSLLAQGRPAPARAIADALLRAAPDDNEARVLMAAALQAEGMHQQSRSFAQAAHRQAETDQTRFDAAMLAGRAEFNRDAYGRAQFWLRRAAQVAPDASGRDLAIRNFGQVRRINPLELRLNFSVRQSSNINNGTSTDVITLWGLPFQVSGNSRALSGLELTTDLSARYRIRQTALQNTALTLNLTARNYRLSSEARTIAPDARSSDYAFQRFEIGAQHRFTFADSESHYEIFAAAGRSWHGGRHLGDHIRASLSQTIALRPRTIVQFSISGQQQWRRDAAERNATRIGGSTLIRHALENANQLSLRMGAETTQARSIHIRNRALHAGLGYTLAEPVLGARLDASLDLEHRRFPQGALQPDGRRDTTATLGVAAMFEDMDYMGFAPVLRLEISNTASNMAIHKRRAANIAVEIRSSF